MPHRLPELHGTGHGHAAEPGAVEGEQGAPTPADVPALVADAPLPTVAAPVHAEEVSGGGQEWTA